MRIMPIINSSSYNVGRYNPSCKGTQSLIDARIAKLQKQGYTLVNDGTITTEDGKILCDKNGHMLPGYFFTKNGKKGYEVLVADESLDKKVPIYVERTIGDKYWCISQEPNSILDIKLPDSTELRLRPNEIQKIMKNPPIKDKDALEKAIRQAETDKNNFWKILAEGYKIFLDEIKIYQSGIRFLNVQADSQGAVKFFRNLGFIGGDYDPNRPMNSLCKKIGKIRAL